MAGKAPRAVPDRVQIAASADERFFFRNKPKTRNSKRRLFFIRVVHVFRGHQFSVTHPCYPCKPRLLLNFQELRPEFPGTDGERQTLPERENQKPKGKQL